MKNTKTSAKKGRNQAGKTIRWDNWHIRLPNPKDQQNVIALYQKSGATSKTEYVRARLLDEHFKVVYVDKTAVGFYRELMNATLHIQKIGVLYNQAVRSIHSYHSVAMARALLTKLERYTQQLAQIMKRVEELTKSYQHYQKTEQRKENG